MIEPPATRYAETADGVHVAYQVVGDGPIDILIVPDWVTVIEASWNWEGYPRLWERLGTLGRLILTDARGSGSSDPDPLGYPATFEHAVDDVAKVLDAIGSDRAFLIGHTNAAMLACLFAATHPERTAGLVLAGGMASYIDRGEGIGFPASFRNELADYIVRSWGDPDSERFRLMLPGEDRDEERRREARLERVAMSPAAVRQHCEMMLDIDIRPVLPSIQAPTLVLHRTGDRLVPVAAGRYLADHIDGARFVELAGDDHFWFLGDVDPMLEEMAEFITGTRPAGEPDRVLVTLMFNRHRRIDRASGPTR
ncbi:MAG TPA: alpha/beta hydrolase [Acidimicrobiales bacterium]|nr:alpha/beta hydrolase [Acidimicrobiales bacterium]